MGWRSLSWGSPSPSGRADVAVSTTSAEGLSALTRGSDRISPTAHYTGHVWFRQGLGDPGLTTTTGRLLFAGGQSVMVAASLLGGPTLEHFLVARHRIIDLLLAQAIDRGEVSQVVELACGMSPRGLRTLRERGTDVTYVEVDLPSMAARKRRALDRLGALSDHLRVEPADVLHDEELERVLRPLDRRRGVVVVTEGLLNYLPRAAVEDLWRRVAGHLSGFEHGLYLSDLHVQSEAALLDRAFAKLLGLAVGGRVQLHYANPAQAQAALLAAGFPQVRLHAPGEYAGRLLGMTTAGANRVRVIEARV